MLHSLWFQYIFLTYGEATAHHRPSVLNSPNSRRAAVAVLEGNWPKYKIQTHMRTACPHCSFCLIHSCLSVCGNSLTFRPLQTTHSRTRLPQILRDQLPRLQIIDLAIAGLNGSVSELDVHDIILVTNVPYFCKILAISIHIMTPKQTIMIIVWNNTYLYLKNIRLHSNTFSN